MRTPITEIGEMIIGFKDKQFFLKPSFRAMMNVGSPKDIVQTYAVLNGLDVRNAISQSMSTFGSIPIYVAKALTTKHYQRSILSAAQVVMQACCDDDLSLMIGGWRAGKRGMVYVPGRMPITDIVKLASYLMDHGVIGKSPLKQPQRSEDSGKTTREFHAIEYISSARAHFGLKREEAEDLSMTEMQMMIKSKYPEPKGYTREEYDSLYEHRNKLRAERLKKEAEKNGAQLNG